MVHGQRRKQQLGAQLRHRRPRQLQGLSIHQLRRHLHQRLQRHRPHPPQLRIRLRNRLKSTPDSSTLVAAFLGATAIKFPGLAAASGHNCLQIDTSGYLTNTGAACGTGSGTGTISSDLANQIAFYSGAGTSLAGETTVPIANGGTGASTASTALAALDGISSTATSGESLAGPLTVPVLNNLTNFANLSGSTVASQFNNWISSTNTAAARSFLWIDPQVASGGPTSAFGSFERILDARGTNCMDAIGGFSYADNSLCIEAAEDSQDSTSAPTNKADLHLSYNSIAGGVYNYGSPTSVKSNRSVLALSGEFSTVAQKWGISSAYSSYAGGETIPFGTSQTEFGGYVSSGQEPAEGLRIQQQRAASPTAPAASGAPSPPASIPQPEL